jgi:hypothetical protein
MLTTIPRSHDEVLDLLWQTQRLTPSSRRIPVAAEGRETNATGHHNSIGPYRIVGVLGEVAWESYTKRNSSNRFDAASRKGDRRGTDTSS